MPEQSMKVELSRTPIDFGQDCMDPLAKMIIVEAMDYAVETAGRRLVSVGKIFSQVEGSGSRTLAVVDEIKNQIASYPNCETKGKEPLVKSVSPAAPKPPTSSPSKPTMSRKQIEGELAKAAAKAGAGQPTGKKATPPPPRTQPTRWQEVEVVTETGETKKYATPGEAARDLGIVVEGAKNMVHAFRRAGFEVTGDGEPQKGVGRFVIKSTGKPIPDEYKLLPKPEEAPVEAKGKAKTKLLPIKVEGKGIVGYDVIVNEKATQRLTPGEGKALLDTKKAELV